MSANFRNFGNWPNQLREYERSGPGPEPSAGLWDRLEENLPPPPEEPRRGFAWWRWGAGALLLLLLGTLTWTALRLDVQPGEVPLAEDAVADGPPGNDYVTSPAAPSAVEAPRTAPASTPGNAGTSAGGVNGAVNGSPRGESIFNPRSANSTVSPTRRPSVNQVIQYAERSREGTPAEENYPGSPTIPPAPATGPPSSDSSQGEETLATRTGVSENGTITFISKPKITERLPTRLDPVILIPELPLPKVVPSATKFTRSRPAFSTEVFAGPGLYQTRVYAPDALDIPTIQERRQQPFTPGVHAGVAAVYGRWQISAGVRYNEQVTENELRRRVILDRSQETAEPGNLLKSSYEVDVNTTATTSRRTVEISRDASLPLGVNPRILLTFDEEYRYKNLSLPVQVSYRQPLFRSPLSLTVGAGMTYNRTTFTQTVELAGANFLNGQPVRRFNVMSPGRETTLPYWSVESALGLHYARPASPLGISLNVLGGRSLGDWRPNRPDGRYLGTLGGQLSVRYRLVR